METLCHMANDETGEPRGGTQNNTVAGLFRPVVPAANRPIIIGLTGGIGAGKSTCSAAARKHGYVVFDVDAEAGRVWADDPDWHDEVRARYGVNERWQLRHQIEKDPDVLNVLYNRMEWRLKQRWEEFQKEHAAEPVIILDAPLLIEKGWNALCDVVVLVATDVVTRSTRVDARPDMTEALFLAFLSTQWKDKDKAKHAHYVVNGGATVDAMTASFMDILSQHAPKVGVYPGTFDPITRGHLQAVEDSLDLFDTVICLIAYNPSKSSGVFTPDERAALMIGAFETSPRLCAAWLAGRLKIGKDTGLLVRYCQKVRATHVIRGLRSLTDFDYEQQMNHVNRRLMPSLRTWFVMSDEKYQIVSSTYARTLAGFGEDTSWLLTPNVQEALAAKNASNRKDAAC